MLIEERLETQVIHMFKYDAMFREYFDENPSIC